MQKTTVTVRARAAESLTLERKSKAEG